MTIPVITVDLPAIAARLLDMLAAKVDNPPARQFRTIGSLAPWPLSSCGQITVALTPMLPGMLVAPTTNRPEETPNGLRTVQFVCEVVRCLDVPEVENDVPASVYDGAAVTHFEDFQAVDRFVRSVGFSSKIHDAALAAAGVRAVAPGQVVSVNPTGGMAAVRGYVTLQV